MRFKIKTLFQIIISLEDCLVNSLLADNSDLQRDLYISCSHENPEQTWIIFVEMPGAALDRVN